MDVSYSPTPHLPSNGGLISELFLYQFLNQLRTHNNITLEHTGQALQHCLESLKHEKERRRQQISQQGNDCAKLSANYVNLQTSYFEAAKEVENLEESCKESSRKYEEKISVLKRQVENETSARMFCERETKLLKDNTNMEQMGKELHEMKNCSHNNDEKINQTLATLQEICENQNIDMDVLCSPTPHLPSNGGLISELFLYQFLNQLRTHNNITLKHTGQALQQCLVILKDEKERRRPQNSQQGEDCTTLYNKYMNIETSYFEAAKQVDCLQESLKESSRKYEEKISVLESQVENETSARMFCERETKLLKDNTNLEQMGKELHEMRNCSHSNDGKIDQILATLQDISVNQNIGKDIHTLETQLSLANETIQNSTEMNARQSRQLEAQRKLIQDLEEKNVQMQASLSKLQEHQQEQVQKFEAQLHKQAEDLKKKDDELKKIHKELADEKNKNIMLQKMLDEMQKKQGDAEKQNTELMEAERRNCSTQMQQQKTTSESELKTEVKKTQEAQNQLKTCNQLLNAAKEQTVVATKHANKVIEFTNRYKKYLASGNIKFAIAVYGDTEIKDIFRSSESIIGKQMTTQEAHKQGFSCGNDRYIPNCFKCDGTDDCGNQNDERNCSTTVFPLGARVVRGTGWKWGSQDGDPPGLGTVIAENKNGGWSRVHWDSGEENNYRIGAEGAIDLRAAAGYFCEAT